MRRLGQLPIEDHLSVIRNLKDELHMAQRTVIELMPSAEQSILSSHHQCVTISDTNGWLQNISEDLIALALPLRRVAQFQIGDRAMCPLCGGEAQSRYEHGFALPDGLRMHLEGSGNARQCPVITAACGLADSHWDDEFGERGSAARAQFELAQEERRSKETQYLVNPYLPARLVDEGLRYRSIRDVDGLAWASERLAAMGFVRSLSKKVVSYVKPTPNSLVYADPRRQGVLQFAVLLKPTVDGLNQWQKRKVPVHRFEMADSRRHDLEKTCDDSIASAVRELLPALRLVE